MNTKVLKPSKESIELACDIIKNNNVVALPTETVYGLFANATSEDACSEIFKVKNRPQDNPLIVHICDYEMLKEVTTEINKDVMKLAEAFWPGALTMILPKSEIIPNGVSANLNTVGVRMPSNPVVLQVIKDTSLPLAGPSANKSGRPSPTNAQDVYRDLNGSLELIVDGGNCDIGVESTVISMIEKPYTIFRPGFITKQQIENILGEQVELSKGIEEELTDEEIVSSPGLKHKHYSPKAEVVIVNASFDKYKQLVEKENAIAFCFDEYIEQLDVKCVTYGKESDSLSQAVNLFKSLRNLDDIGAKKAYAMMPNTNGIGLAVYNRLLRAAAFKVINL